jgi:ribosomal protein L7/L12
MCNEYNQERYQNRMTSSKHTIPDAAISAIESGKHLDAARIIRQETGLGLKEAKDLIDEYLTQGASAQSPLEVQHQTPSIQMPMEAINALQKGNKIEAIRFIREENKMGLKDAKDYVEQYIKDNPSIQSQFAARQRESLQGIRWLIISILIIGLTYYYLFVK